MDTISPLLDLLSTEELHNLQKILIDKLASKESLIKKIKSEVKNNGYTWTVSNIDTSKICNKHIGYSAFPLYCYVETTNKKEDICYYELADKVYEQPEWVEKLKCNYVITEEDCKNYDLVEPVENNVWVKTKHGTIRTLARMIVLVFYKNTVPYTTKLVSGRVPTKSKFKAFDEDGNIEEWSIVNDKLYCDGKCYGSPDDYDNFFIVP